MRRGFFSSLFFCGVLLTACIVLTGCTPMKKAPPAATKATEPYRVEKEGDVPPLQPQDVRKEVDREEKYEDLPVADEPVNVETVEPETPPPDASPSGGPSKSLDSAAKMMDGYRVQVFASASEAVAQSARQAAEVRLGVAAYVEFIDRMYKVRVGDCPTRDEADVLLQKCRDAGYGDAWVASGRIFMPKR